MEPFSSEAEFLFDQDQEQPAPSLSEESWAELVFIDPISLVPKLSAAASYGDSLNDKDLTALYADWQSRESEIGYALVERRKRDLRTAIESWRTYLERRYRAVVSAKAHLQTIQRINATEPDPALHYPVDMIQRLETEISAGENESQYLQLYISRMAALASVLQTMYASGRTDLVEQYCRLIGQAWRGQMKLRAFHNKFPFAFRERPPAEGLQAIIVGEIIPECAAESAFATDLVLPYATVDYLMHLLRTIAVLRERTLALFNPALRSTQLDADWPSAMVLLAAIVELFYFCSFEMTYSSFGRVVEQLNSSRSWNFNFEKSEWEQYEEQRLDQLRRQAADTAMLLVESPPFLRCTNTEDVARAVQTGLSRIKPEALTQAYGPYQFTGLARMEQRAEGRSFKFQNAHKVTGIVIEHLVKSDPKLTALFNTECGGPLQTFVAMANLEPKAFGLSGGEELLSRPMALKVLANFWKRMGKRRPVALLGDVYAKGIYKGLAGIGESAPEFSSLLSVHLTNVFGGTLFGSGKEPTDLLTVLMLADQIRLVDLLDLSLSYLQAVIGDLQKVSSLSEIGSLIESGGEFARYEADIAKRFNQKWITAKQPLWTLLRGAAPHAWGFWAKLSAGNSVSQLLGGVDPGQALGYLLLPLADMVRLMLLFETSSPVLAERQRVDAETAARELLAGFVGFCDWPSPFGTVIQEHLSYYFDWTIQHDSWVSFTESLKQHLKQLDEDLKLRQANPAIVEMLAAVLTRLEANHPSPQRMIIEADEAGTSDAIIELPDYELAESDCLLLQSLCADLIGERGAVHTTFLKSIALWRSKELREALRKIWESRKSLREFLDEQSLRLTLISSQTAVREIGRLLESDKNDNADTINDETAAAIINALNRERELQHQLEAELAMPTLPFDDDHARVFELSVKTDGEIAELLMVSFSNIPSLVAVKNDGPEKAVRRYELELKNRARRQFPNWNPEALILGAVTLCASRSGLALSNSRLEIDPIFHEPNKPASARMLWTFASNKLGLALKLLQAELVDSIVSIRV